MRPNILLVLFDDVGFTGFGAYGSDARTPTIDALAQSGTIFSRYYTSPFCGPSRAMLMTGQDNHQVGMGTLVETVTDDQRALPGYSMVFDDNQQTIASLLSEAGYQTYVTGKWGIGAKGKNLPNRFGFDRSYVMDSTGGSNYDHRYYLPGYPEVPWYEDGAPVRLPEDFYSSRDLVDKMIRYIDEGDADQPFFGFLSLQAVHIPVQAPAEFIDRYDGVFDTGWDVMREDRWKRAIELGLVPETTTLAPVHEDHRAWIVILIGLLALVALAVVYAAWAGARLPTEVEWDYAASRGLFDPMDPESGVRAPDGTVRANFWTGLFPVLNSRRDGFAGTAPVGCFAPGLTKARDMIALSGNGPTAPLRPPCRALPSRAAPTCAARIIANDTASPPAKAWSTISAPRISDFASCRI